MEPSAWDESPICHNQIFSSTQPATLSLSLAKWVRGRDWLARPFYADSPRCDRPFVIVNCGAFPQHLLESGLSGCQEGAFRDVKASRKGRIELVHGGALFLDKIGQLGMKMQIDLLRIMEEGIFYRVGGAQPIAADFRVIAATDRDLGGDIERGAFKEELSYRLNAISFAMPPLRDRKEDIPLLAEHFLRRFSLETDRQIDRISHEAMDKMMRYEWPGNVRGPEMPLKGLLSSEREAGSCRRTCPSYIENRVGLPRINPVFVLNPESRCSGKP